jgi:threonine synthase
MDAMLIANRNGHIACTQGGESLAGIRKLVASKRIDPGYSAVLDATAHALKFAMFQEKYFSDSFESEFEVIPKKELQNAPLLVNPPVGTPRPEPGKSLKPDDLQAFVKYAADAVATMLDLKQRSED